MEGTIISEEAIKTAAYFWATMTWEHDIEPFMEANELKEEEEPELGETWTHWLEVQLDVDKTLPKMLVDDLEEHIHKYELAYQDHQNVLTDGVDDDDLYEESLKAWAEIKWFIAHDGSLDYEGDTVLYEADAMQYLHAQIEEAGGEEAYYNELQKG